MNTYTIVEVTDWYSPSANGRVRRQWALLEDSPKEGDCLGIGSFKSLVERVARMRSYGRKED